MFSEEKTTRSHKHPAKTCFIQVQLLYSQDLRSRRQSEQLIPQTDPKYGDGLLSFLCPSHEPGEGFHGRGTHRGIPGSVADEHPVVLDTVRVCLQVVIEGNHRERHILVSDEIPGMGWDGHGME